jgi:hypothetical protein
MYKEYWDTVCALWNFPRFWKIWSSNDEMEICFHVWTSLRKSNYPYPKVGYASLYFTSNINITIFQIKWDSLMLQKDHYQKQKLYFCWYRESINYFHITHCYFVQISLKSLICNVGLALTKMLKQLSSSCAFNRTLRIGRHKIRLAQICIQFHGGGMIKANIF